MKTEIIYVIRNQVDSTMYYGRTSNYSMRVRRFYSEANPKVTVARQSPLIKEMRRLGADSFEIYKYSDELYTVFEANAIIDKLIDTAKKAGTKLYNTRQASAANKVGGTTRTNFKHTEEHKLSLSNGIVVFKNNMFAVYPSSKAYADELGCDSRLISRVAREGKKYKKAYIYYTDNKKRLEKLQEHKFYKRYLEIGLVLHKIGVEDIDGVIYLTPELTDHEM